MTDARFEELLDELLDSVRDYGGDLFKAANEFQANHPELSEDDMASLFEAAWDVWVFTPDDETVIWDAMDQPSWVWHGTSH